MDTREKPKRPWWRKKPSAMLLLVYLAILYPLSSGAMTYCVGRGWLPTAVMLSVEVIYTPLQHLNELVPFKIGGRTAESWWRKWNSDLADFGAGRTDR